MAKASSGAAFINKKRAAEARLAAQESGIDMDDSLNDEDIFELQHHHLLRCLEKTTVREKLKNFKKKYFKVSIIIFRIENFWIWTTIMEWRKPKDQRHHHQWLVQVIRPTQLQVCCNRVVVDVAHKDIRYLGSFSKIQHYTYKYIHTLTHTHQNYVVFF